jgi:hypothetical protein
LIGASFLIGERRWARPPGPGDFWQRKQIRPIDGINAKMGQSSRNVGKIG